MQSVVIDKPYRFVAPSRSRLWPRAFQALLPWRLRWTYGIHALEQSGAGRIAASLRAGCGVMLAPNHCRPCDGEVVHALCRSVPTQPFMMASWHLFQASRLQAFVLRRSGAFSVYREGTDRAAVATAVDLLDEGARPVVVFPEGVQTRTNERLNPMLEGAAFIARAAARARARRGATARVVVHPVALRYTFGGDIEAAVAPVLADIERRLSWTPQTHLALAPRLVKVAFALLALKEIEYFDRPRDGTAAERIAGLVDGLLAPLEAEWLGGARGPHVVARVKALRAAVLRDMLAGELPEEERARRWAQMARIYVAQAISLYPPRYVTESPTPDRILETVERLEEDLTDRCRRYAPMRVHVTVGEAIPVGVERGHGHDDDPLTERIAEDLAALLGLGRGAASA